MRQFLTFATESNWRTFTDHHPSSGTIWNSLTRDFLTWFANAESSSLEQVEKLEQLRAIEAGKWIQVVEVDHRAVGIDTQKDFDQFVVKDLWLTDFVRVPSTLLLPKKQKDYMLNFSRNENSASQRTTLSISHRLLLASESSRIS